MCSNANETTSEANTCVIVSGTGTDGNTYAVWIGTITSDVYGLPSGPAGQVKGRSLRP